MKNIIAILCYLFSFLVFANPILINNKINTDKDLFEKKTGIKVNLSLKRRHFVEECVNFSGKWTLLEDISKIPEKLKPEFLEIEQIDCNYIFVRDSHYNYLGYFEIGHHLISFPTRDNPFGLHSASKWNSPYEIDGTMSTLHLTGWPMSWNWIFALVSNKSDTIKVEINTLSINDNYSKDSHNFVGIFKKTSPLPSNKE